MQFSVRIQFSSIWSIDRTLLGASTTGQSGPVSDCNEGVPHISQSSSITETSPSDYLVSYPGYWLGVGPYLSSEMQLVYSAVLADWAM